MASIHRVMGLLGTPIAISTGDRALPRQVVSATGSGKSTLVKLLLRFYEVQNGSILIDNLDIRTLKLYDLRHSIGWVSQDVFLFHGTVAENIRYGSFDATHEQIHPGHKVSGSP